MDDERFIDRVQQRAAIADRGSALRATTCVLAALDVLLFEDELARVRGALPGPLAAAVPRRSRAEAAAPPGAASSTLETFYARVQQREGARTSASIEHARAVCQVVAEAVGAETAARWARELPPATAALFALAPRGEPEAPVAEPGSGGPARDAYPPHAHRESVAHAANPHAATKLSSSTGLTQEREHDTLAEGRPGSKRPLSGD